MAWTDPITWVFEQVISAGLLNQQIRDNLNYLKVKPIDIVTFTGGDYSLFPANTWTKIPQADLVIDIDGASNLEFGMRITITTGAADNYIDWDVYDADTNVYLSSGTSTPNTYGLGRFLVDNNTSRDGLLYAEAIWVDVADGAHNYEIHLRTVSNALSLEHASTTNQVWVREL